ncbi:MAG: site-specific integrase [Chitinophagaceae bacterium]|nr:site-specific integrase [Chitinophagaceae bacterium]
METIHTKQFLTERLSVVRDVFIFCIYTGLSHSDVAKLTQDHIVEGEDGKSWLSFKRTKTDVPCKVPLLKTAVEILEKYKEDPECLYKKRLLPVRANQKMNEYLKEIADLCRINKVITCHTARHTYATTILLGNGISIEAACKLLGHRDIRTTQIYARMTDNRIVQEFKALAHL